MVSWTRESGPEETVRPYKPTQPASQTDGRKTSKGEKVIEALDHIAVSLSAIDHNLETLVSRLGTLGKQAR